MAGEVLVIVDQDLNVTIQNTVAQPTVISPVPAILSVTSPTVPTLVQVDSTGLPGPTGPGVHPGGTAGQALVKLDDTDYNTQWITTSLGHIVEDEGTPLPQQPSLNFAGSGVAVTDDAGNSATLVTIANDHSQLTNLSNDVTAGSE